jgi:hypothetical protein
VFDSDEELAELVPETAESDAFAFVIGVGVAFFTASYMRYEPIPMRSNPSALTG